MFNGPRTLVKEKCKTHRKRLQQTHTIVAGEHMINITHNSQPQRTYYKHKLQGRLNSKSHYTLKTRPIY